jgi:SAM-dependent methyltransferase
LDGLSLLNALHLGDVNAGQSAGESFMMDIFDETVASYRDEAGAAAFIAKEVRHKEGNRDATAYSMLDGLDLAGVRALDVGCGFGRDVGELRRRGAVAFGCDVSPPLLAEAEKAFGPYFTEYDLRSGAPLPFGGGFDLIWCCAVLVHVPRAELRVFFGRLWDGLAVGGRLVLITKQGEGQTVARNLGEALPRVMVMYAVEEILAVLRELGAVVEMEVPDLSVTAYGEAVLGVRVRKV